jgi:hypothetical protein
VNLIAGIVRKAWLHQVLCCLTLAFGIVSAAQQQDDSTFLGILAYPFYTYIFPHASARFQRGGLFFCMALLLAIILFLLTNAFSCLQRLRTALAISAGIVAIATYPVVCLWNLWFWMRMDFKHFLLCLECILVIVAVLFYFYRHSRRLERLALVILAVHVSIWIVASGGLGYAVELAHAYGLADWRSWALLLESLLLPILSVLSSIAWGAFVSNDSKAVTLRSAGTL